MAENEVQSADGRVWTVTEFALAHGYKLSLEAFSDICQGTFNVRGYERMQELFDLRERSIRMAEPFPEGGDINERL